MLGIDDFSAKQCKSGVNTQFSAKHGLLLDLRAIAEEAEKSRAEIEVNAPSLLILRFKGTQFDLQKEKIKVHARNIEIGLAAFESIIPFLRQAKSPKAKK